MKLLCLCDSPTMNSGFGRVAKNLITRWNGLDIFEDIWVWGIGYTGFPHSIKFLENRICPASSYNFPAWYDPQNLQRFLRLLEKDELGGSEGGFTHVWILQDTFLLYRMAAAFKKLARDRGLKTLLYFPVDAPIEPEWANMIDAVDVPVAYCEYGASEARKALAIESKDKSVNKSRRRAAERLKIIPHGVDTSIYQRIGEPGSKERDALRARNRKGLFNGQVRDDDFVMLNVSQNQKRKGLSQSLGVLEALKRKFPEMKPKLFINAPAENQSEQTHLGLVALQMGLELGEDIFFGDSSYDNGHAILPEENLNAIYNSCDLLLSTSYGEGWGLPITEAMATGLPVAGPRHTSIQELLADGRGILFNTLGHDVLPFDNSRLRPRADVDHAAMRINYAWARGEESGGLGDHVAAGCEWARSQFLNWDRIAGEWMNLMVG